MYNHRSKILVPVKAIKTIKVLIILLIAKKVFIKNDSRIIANSSIIPKERRDRFKILKK